MQFKALPLDDHRRIRLDARSSPAFQFPEGRAVFAAFQLPIGQKAAFLRLRTYPTSALGYLPSATMLLPYIVFLDAQKEVLGFENSYRLYRRSGFHRATYFHTEVRIPDSASYFVAYSAPSGSRTMIAYSDHGTRFDIPIAHRGLISVHIVK